jgi:hypothetical protein
MIRHLKQNLSDVSWIPIGRGCATYMWEDADQNISDVSYTPLLVTLNLEILIVYFVQLPIFSFGKPPYQSAWFGI